MFAKFPDCLKVAFIDCVSWQSAGFWISTRRMSSSHAVPSLFEFLIPTEFFGWNWKLIPSKLGNFCASMLCPWAVGGRAKHLKHFTNSWNRLNRHPTIFWINRLHLTTQRLKNKDDKGITAELDSVHPKQKRRYYSSLIDGACEDLPTGLKKAAVLHLKHHVLTRSSCKVSIVLNWHVELFLLALPRLVLENCLKQELEEPLLG